MTTQSSSMPWLAACAGDELDVRGEGVKTTHPAERPARAVDRGRQHRCGPTGQGERQHVHAPDIEHLEAVALERSPRRANRPQRVVLKLTVVVLPSAPGDRLEIGETVRELVAIHDAGWAQHAV